MPGCPPTHGRCGTAPGPRSFADSLAFDWAPQRTGNWAEYTAQVDVGALLPPHGASGTSAGLRVRVGSPGEVTIQASRHWVSVRQVQRLVLSARLPAAHVSHRLTLQVRERVTVVSVDGRVLAWVSTPSGSVGSGGVGLVATRPQVGRPFATFTQLIVRPTPAR